MYTVRTFKHVCVYQKKNEKNPCIDNLNYIIVDTKKYNSCDFFDRHISKGFNTKSVSMLETICI